MTYNFKSNSIFKFFPTPFDVIRKYKKSNITIFLKNNQYFFHNTLKTLHLIHQNLSDLSV